MTIRVILADDHAMVREALAQILVESGSIQVVGQAADGPQALDLAAKLQPRLCGIWPKTSTIPSSDGASWPTPRSLR